MNEGALTDLSPGPNTRSLHDHRAISVPGNQFRDCAGQIPTKMMIYTNPLDLAVLTEPIGLLGSVLREKTGVLHHKNPSCHLRTRMIVPLRGIMAPEGIYMNYLRKEFRAGPPHGEHRREATGLAHSPPVQWPGVL